MSHLDNAVYTVLIATGPDLAQTYSIVHWTWGNKHTQTQTSRKWRALGCWVQGVRDQTLCCRKGHVGGQHTLIHFHEHMRPRKTHTDNCTENLYTPIQWEYRPTPHAQAYKNSPQTLSKMDIWEDIVDREIGRQFQRQLLDTRITDIGLNSSDVQTAAKVREYKEEWLHSSRGKKGKGCGAIIQMKSGRW